MKLNQLRITNFRSYYSEVSFDFNDGLTLIIGGNGDGKTTFFDALDWLFSTDKDNVNLISEMKKAEMSDGESSTVSVELDFEHNGHKTLKKSFRFHKTESNNIETQDFSFQGWQTVGSDREMVKGSAMVEVCFDAYIRRYCLFKGESNLNIFDDDRALTVLVERFSKIREFDKYVGILKKLEVLAGKAHAKELNADKSVKNAAEKLSKDKQELTRDLESLDLKIAQQTTLYDDYDTKITDVEKHKESSENYRNIINRIENLKTKRAEISKNINEDYSINLLDSEWILFLFPPIFDEYRRKASQLEKEKRKLEDEFNRQRGVEIGKKSVISEIVTMSNGTTPLSASVPTGETMQEMLDDEICKVCNRKAKKGSEAYIFMQEKLSAYIRSIGPDSNLTKEKQLFSKSYIADLFHLGLSMGGPEAKRVSNLRDEINSCVNFNVKQKEELTQIDEQIREAEEEKARILIQSNGVSEEVLAVSIIDYGGYCAEKSRAEEKLETYRKERNFILERLRANKDEYNALKPKNLTAKLQAKVHKTFEQMLSASISAKQTNLNSFLADLEGRTNKYLKFLNVGDFHGQVEIRQNIKHAPVITLLSSSGQKIANPNGALQTTMYMALLFAISDLTTLKREEDYPLIFDAPTSSFELTKEEQFYNVIASIKKQCIIATKDLLIVDKETGDKQLDNVKIQELACSVYRIQKKLPFTANDISTIQTISIPIK